MSTDVALLEQRPSYLQDYTGPLGTERMDEYMVPPRLKVVQKNSSAALLEKFNPGDVILLPQAVLVSGVVLNDKNKPTDVGKPFHVVPLFFFPEWVAFNPLETRGTLPSVRYRTFDSKDPIVAKCKDSRLWLEPCPEMPEKDGKQLKVTNRELLNFVVAIVGNGEHCEIPVTLTFSSASHFTGATWCTQIRNKRAPCYSCQFEMRTRLGNNSKGEWYRLEISNPSENSGVSPWVSPEERFREYEKLYRNLQETFDKKLLRPDISGEEETVASDDAVPASRF